MGQTLPNISIYVPAAGETNYDQAFLQGMQYLDAHDHSGGPTKGVAISTTGLANDSVTAAKLNDDCAGLGLVRNGVSKALDVNVDNTTVEVSADVLRVKDLGITNAKIANATIANAKLVNSTVSIDGTAFTLGANVNNPNYPNRCVFSAFKSANSANVTGNGAIYTVICDDASIVNVGTVYNTATGVFTAPVTGNYFLSGKVRIFDFVGATFAQFRIQTSAKLIVGDEFNPATTGTGYQGGNVSGLVRLTAGQTASMTVQVSGLAGDTADVAGDGTDLITYFSAYLVS